LTFCFAPSISFSHISTIAPQEAERTTATTTPTTPGVSAFDQRPGATRPTHRCSGNTATYLGVNDTTRLPDHKVGCSMSVCLLVACIDVLCPFFELKEQKSQRFGVMHLNSLHRLPIFNFQNGFKVDNLTKPPTP